MKTVNDLMIWLNQQIGLNLPTKASFAKWPMLRALWNLKIPTGFPSGKLPWKVSVQGSWSLIRGMKPAKNIAIEVKNRKQFMEEQSKSKQFGKLDTASPKDSNFK
jgi:hypothetical protein